MSLQIDARVVGLLAQREAARLKQSPRVENKDRQERIIHRVRYLAERIYRTLLNECAAMEKREAGL